jgi:transglutaminase-like putative cysteine protease
MRILPSFQSMAHLLRRPMSRDKSDTLLLLAACTLVLAPHFWHLPASGILACLGLLVWRSWITFKGWRLPPRWLLIPIAIIAMIIVYATHRSFFGQEVGVSMLTLLLALKLLEMHAKRDLFVVLYLCFFLLLANFFYSQSIGTALLTVLSVVAILTAQMSFQYTGAVPPLRQRLKSSLLIISLSAPLMLVLFILFPRIEGPLWGLPTDAHNARSGLADSMAPGNLSRLAQSDDIAFRVHFMDPVPPRSKLYWRGIVLGSFDGYTWTQQDISNRIYTPTTVETYGPSIRHQVTLEPHGRQWLFALEVPENAPVLNGNHAVISRDQQLLSREPIKERLRYDVTSHVDFILQREESESVLRSSLKLPIGFNPRTTNFARALRAQYANNAQLANAVLKYFHDEPFRYTLEPPLLLNSHSIDQFLFSTRAGFCEHYAGAFVFIMRAAGIPARVVTGYQGGEINPVDGFMTVRQSDAHAWTEIWLAGRGWIRVDPTAAVAPERIEKNLTGALPGMDLGVFGGILNFSADKNSILAKLRFNWDAVNNAWNQRVLNFNPENQIKLLHSLGFENVDWRTLIALLVAACSIVMVVMAVPLFMNQQKREPIQVIYADLCLLMAKLGFPRAIHEGPLDYRTRLTANESGLSTEKKAVVNRFLMLYEAAQYGTLNAASKNEAISELKSLLSECR